MKILCLHGYGTSGQIFEQQMTSLIQTIGDQHEFVFIDGEVPVKRSELAGLYEGETLCFYDGFSPDSQAPAHELLAETIAAEEPPFDGICGFSQGGGFAISYLLQHLIDHPDKALPFKFGIFFTPASCISPFQDYKQKEVDSFLGKFGHDEHEDLKTTLLARKTPKNLEDYDAVKKLSAQEKELMYELMYEVKAMYDTRTAFNIEERATPLDVIKGHDNHTSADFPKFFNPIYTAERIGIPTVHVLGTRDEAGPTSLAKIARKLCVPDKVIVVETSGAHEIPYKQAEVNNVARAIEKAIYMSQMTPTVF